MGVRPEYMLASSGESPFYGASKSMAQVLARMSGDAPRPGELPDGWLMRRWSGWEVWTPYDWVPRLQGWKIHVSAVPEDAQETLTRTIRLCVAREVSFKFRHEPGSLDDINGKQHDRGSSGKFITIYPADDAQLASLLEELETALAGQRGPYILSDLRYGVAPVFVRYGGVVGMTYADADDEPVYAITDESMRLIPDHRRPRFSVPDGVVLPECLAAAHERSRGSSNSRIQEFASLSPLHFSNAGGVYRATLGDGTQHILREARSFTGLDARGRDAVTRQEVEQGVLADLDGVAGVQRLVGSFWAWEHRYLELEYAPGSPLTSWIVQNTPFTAGQDGSDCLRYGERARAIGEQLVRIVEAIHQRGWAVGDLHPGNVIVDEDDGVTLIDLEDASRTDAEREIGFRVFEFCGPDHFTAVQSDWYALSRCLMMMYVPDWEIEMIAPGFWDESVERISERFGPASSAQIRAVVERFPHVEGHMLSPRETVAPWTPDPLGPDVLDALDEGIEWSRQFSPTGSFPGDPLQGEVGESLGYGSAGVVWSRTRRGRSSADADLDALQRAATKGGPAIGLYTGQAGIALALADQGRHDTARRAASEALTEALGRRRLDLHAGQAGIILAAIEVAQAAGDEHLLGDALAANERLQLDARPGSTSWVDLTQRRGLAHGPTGLALVDVAAHLATGERRHLERAASVLREELDACITTPSGELDVRDTLNHRALPYLEWGSGGIWGVAQVVERLLGHRIVTADEVSGLVRACSSDLYIYGTLAHGRAGLLAVLASSGEAPAGEVERQTRLTLERLYLREGMLLTPGDGTMRLSSDLCTGAAGVALALHEVWTDTPFLWLPVRHETALRIASTSIPARGDAVRQEMGDESPMGIEKR